MATVQWREHKRKSGETTRTAYLNWSKRSRQCRQSLGQISDDEAEDFRLAKELELRTDNQVISFSLLLGEFAEDYLTWRAMEYPDSQFRVAQKHLAQAMDGFSI